jgi:small subunit ribosomal protein S16
LTRVGGKKNPIWRVIVADQRSPRDGRAIETIGRYNAQTDPSEIVLDEERLNHWLARGAQPTNTVRKLMRAKGIGTAAGTSAPAAEAPPAEASAPTADDSATKDAGTPA